MKYLMTKINAPNRHQAEKYAQEHADTIHPYWFWCDTETVYIYCKDIFAAAAGSKEYQRKLPSFTNDADFFSKYIHWDGNTETPSIPPASTLFTCPRNDGDRRFHAYIQNGEVEVLDDSSDCYKP